jgi:hypothetical protein
VIELSAHHLAADINTPFKKIQDQRGLRNEEIIGYYFNVMQSDAPNKQAYLRQLELYYFKEKPKLNTVVLRQLLFGNLDSKILKSHALQYLKKRPPGSEQLQYTQSLFD